MLYLFKHEWQRGAEGLGADVFHMAVDGVVPLAALELDDDAVGDVELLLMDLLDAVHQLALWRKTF